MVQASARQRKQGQRGDAPAYNQQAIAYLQQGKLRKARACINEALRLQPDFPNCAREPGQYLLLPREIRRGPGLL